MPNLENKNSEKNNLNDRQDLEINRRKTPKKHKKIQTTKEHWLKKRCKEVEQLRGHQKN